LPRAHRADPANAPAAVADGMLLDDETFLTVIAQDDARGTITEFGVDVMVPEIKRFEDVPISIDDVVNAPHTPPPLSSIEDI